MLRNARLIAQRELRRNLRHSFTAIAVAAVFSALGGAFFFAFLVQTGFAQTSMAGFVEGARLLVVPIAAILTMGLFAEERANGTLELLLAAPIADADIVLGKFVAGLVLWCAMLLPTLYFPFLLAIFGQPDWGVVVAVYLGLLLLGAVCVAVGTFSSVIGNGAIVSAMLCLGILALLYYAASAAQALPPAFAPWIAALSLPMRFDPFLRGIVDLGDVVFHLSLCAGFLVLATYGVSRLRRG